MFIDRETGEYVEETIYGVPSIVVNDSGNNAETGEPEIINIQSIGRRIPFQIPKEFKENFFERENTKSKNQLHKNVIPFTEGTSFGQMNPIFLFLPAIIYFKWFAAILALFEAILHRWTHHKNKNLKDIDVYYRSPFHGISSEFCALCQDETRMDRVGKMQQIRMHKFLRHCHYMKRAVT